MHPMKILVFLVILQLPVVGGCFNLKQPSNRIDYYTLEYTSPEISDLTPLSAVVRVERFTIAPEYNTMRIIYRDRSFVRNDYMYRQWRASPADLVTYFLARDMRRSGLFDAVLPYDSRLPTQYVLEGAVDEFYEKEDDDGWYGVLSVGITLTEEDEPDSTENVYYQRMYHGQERMKRKNPQALAEAMSVMMARISQDMIKDIYGQLQAIHHKE